MSIILTEYEQSLFKLFNDFSNSEFIKNFFQKIINICDKNYCIEDTNELSKFYAQIDQHNFNNIRETLTNDFYVEKIKKKIQDNDYPLIEIRIAGGWVRDKILNIDNFDFDFAIDVMKGLHFSFLFFNYIEYNNISKLTFGNNYHFINRSSKINFIRDDPNSNKFISSAKISKDFLGYEMDFVNLRKEEYDSLSRKPKITFGTISDDAFRRDFTINSLFFNIQNNKVEDFTLKGLKDLLEYKIIDTSLDPFIIFNEDPLRLFRALRFSAKFDFRLSPQIKKILINIPIKILDSLTKKVKRERFFIEFDKIFDYKLKNKALFIIFESIELQNLLFNLKNINEVELNKFYSNVKKNKLKENFKIYEIEYINIYNDISKIILDRKFLKNYETKFIIIDKLFGNFSMKKIKKSLLIFYLNIILTIYENSNNFLKSKDNIIKYILYENCSIPLIYFDIINCIFDILILINKINDNCSYDIILLNIFKCIDKNYLGCFKNIEKNYFEDFWNVSKYFFKMKNDLNPIIESINIADCITIFEIILIKKKKLSRQ